MDVGKADAPFSIRSYVEWIGDRGYELAERMGETYPGKIVTSFFHSFSTANDLPPAPPGPAAGSHTGQPRI